MPRSAATAAPPRGAAAARSPPRDRRLAGRWSVRPRRPHTGPAHTGPGAQAADIRRPKPSRASALQVVQAHGAHPDADEPIDRGADGPEHPAQLALPALRQDRAIPGQVAGRRRDELDQTSGLDLGRGAQTGERRETLVERDACLDRLDLIRAEGRTQPDRVFALDAVAWMEHAIRPC